MDLLAHGDAWHQSDRTADPNRRHGRCNKRRFEAGERFANDALDADAPVVAVNATPVLGVCSVRAGDSVARRCDVAATLLERGGVRG